MKTKKILTILVGIPCSGKSTHASQVCQYYGCETVVISRDNIREMVFGPKYRPNIEDEKLVTEYFNAEVEQAISDDKHIVLDNTHCKQKYIDAIINRYSERMDIRVEFFDISFIKACYRNIIRRITTGKWIPWKVMWHMYKNYNKIDRKKYEEITVT